MKKVTKFLSLLLVLAMTLSLAVPMVSAADFTDVDKSHQYYDAIQSLVARGIISGMGDGTFAPEANIKRSEFAKMVVLSIGITNAGDAVESSGFPDVAKDHWAAGYIKTAFGQGIINGFEDGTFRPDENVTYEQAITMVIRAKSPILKAEAEKIGYPDGYLQLAKRYRFLKGITDGINRQPAKRGTIAKLMDNTLKVELSNENMGGIPQIEPDLSEEVKGQVMAVRGTSLIDGDTDSLNTYQLKLKESDGNIAVYDARNTSEKDSLRSYLGKQVILYYDNDDSSRIQTINSIGEQRGCNYEVTVSLDAIEDYSSNFVEYDNGDRSEKISVASPVIMYNGSLTSSSLSDLITSNLGRAGSIRFLCSEGEGTEADVIFFTSYTNWYVTSTTSSTKMVYGEVAGVRNNIVIDDESRDKTVTIVKNGKSVSFSSIQKGQILSISKSDNEKVMDVIISDKTVSGVVTAKNDGLNNITVQSKTYGFTDGLTSADINLGVNLKLYIDAFGKVAKYTHQMVSANYVYGYLLQASIDGNSMNPQVAMSILDIKATASPTPTNLYLADSVTINNTNYKPANNAEGILTLLKDTAEYYDAASGDYEFGSENVFQPIRYSKTSDGKINTLYIGTQAVAATESDLKVDRTFTDTGVSCTSAGSSPQFNPHFKLNSSTPVVFVPTSDADRSIASKYKVVTAGNAKFSQGSSYKVIAVDTTSLVPKALIVYRDPQAVASTEWENCLPKVVVSKRIVPGPRYEVDLLGFDDSRAVTYYDTDGTFYNAVSEGDVVRVSADTDKKVEEYEISAQATEIYAGNEYIKPIQRSISNRVVDMYGTPMNGTYSHFAEGDRGTTRKITLYAGVAYDIQDGGLVRLVKEYPSAGSPWTLESLTNDNTKIINTSGSKVVLVEFDGAVVKTDKDGVGAKTIDIGQLLPYEDQQENTDKLVVYCVGDNARMIVVYRDSEK